MALAAVQLLAEDMHGGITFNFELKAPAALSLLTFGERGVAALVESARRTPTSKNVSLCLSLLSHAANGNLPRILVSFTKDDSLISKAQSVVTDSQAVRDAARTQLVSFILSIEDDESAMSHVGAELSNAFIGNNRAALELFRALAARSLAVSRLTLETYEQLIINKADDEPSFQQFFEQHPQLLDPMALDVWPTPDLAGARKPDFVIRRIDDSYLIVEIEVPGKQLMTAANQLGAWATQAIAQATEYHEFLVQRFPLAVAHFPQFSDPDCLVVIGVESALNIEQRSALARDNASRKQLRVVGFDWLGKRAESILKNIVTAPISSHKLRMA
jgi:hypothetical protein